MVPTVSINARFERWKAANFAAMLTLPWGTFVIGSSLPPNNALFTTVLIAALGCVITMAAISTRAATRQVDLTLRELYTIGTLIMLMTVLGGCLVGQMVSLMQVLHHVHM